MRRRRRYVPRWRAPRAPTASGHAGGMAVRWAGGPVAVKLCLNSGDEAAGDLRREVNLSLALQELALQRVVKVGGGCG